MTLHDIVADTAPLTTKLNQKFVAIAKAQLQKRLHSNFVKINSNLEIDPSYITCAEYQLFIDEKRGDQFYYQPSHWQEFTFPKGQEQFPIVGVHYKDARAFCEWLNKQDPKHIYYLPEAKSIKDFPIKRRINVSPWLNNGKIEKGFNQALLSKLKRTTKATIPLPLNLDLDGIFDFDHASILDSILTQILDLDLNLDLTCDLNSAFSSAFNLARDRVLVIDRILSLDFDFDLALTHVINLAPVLDSNLGLEIPDKYDKKGWEKTQSRLISFLQGELIDLQKKRAELFLDLTKVMLAYHSKNRLKLRQAYRIYIQRMMVYVYEGAPFSQNKKSKSPWQFWKRGGANNYSKNVPKTNNYVEETQRIAQTFYWQLEIIKLREEGMLPAWKGIRLVRKKRFGRPLSFYH